MKLPTDHPQRAYANAEVHARPSDALQAPLRISYLALFSTSTADEDWSQLRELARRFDTSIPEVPRNHYSCDFGPMRIRWERHTEFVRYTFIVAGLAQDPFAEPALAAVPDDWLAALTGEVIIASHAALVAGDEDVNYEALSSSFFAGNALVGSAIAEGAAIAVTDFRVQADGCSRLLVIDYGMSTRQAGRVMQTLLELDTYRMMALLALPAAREIAPFLSQAERELSAVTTELADAHAQDESGLLDRLTRLEAQIESRQSRTLYRFDAAAAYYELVQRRSAELREVRLHGIPTFQEFIERRLAPAMNTCRAVAARQQSLSERVARTNDLLSTRIDIVREQQNQALLESMNRRAQAQLRLQQTVEQLSIAAVTYYVVGLIGYAAKGLHAAGVEVQPELAMALGIPIVALLAAVGIRKTRAAVEHTTN